METSVESNANSHRDSVHTTLAFFAASCQTRVSTCASKKKPLRNSKSKKSNATGTHFFRHSACFLVVLLGFCLLVAKKKRKNVAKRGENDKRASPK